MLMLVSNHQQGSIGSLLGSILISAYWCTLSLCFSIFRQAGFPYEVWLALKQTQEARGVYRWQDGRYPIKGWQTTGDIPYKECVIMRNDIHFYDWDCSELKQFYCQHSLGEWPGFFTYHHLSFINIRSLT